MSKTPPTGLHRIEALVEIMANLRDPDGGCPWDLEQTFETIAPYTLEEAYEVSDAIQTGDMDGLKDELGDLLLQVIYHSQMAKEAGLFDLADVIKSISNKMIRRHPHVYGQADIDTAEAQTANWEEIKAAERALKSKNQPQAQSDKPPSVLDGIPVALPALVRATKITNRVARIGFDWQDAEDIYAKLDEEVLEVREAVESGDQNAIMDELGDVLFVVANLCRKYHVNPEQALTGTNQKFTNRFTYMEKRMSEMGVQPPTLGLKELDNLWSEAKAHESAKNQK